MKSMCREIGMTYWLEQAAANEGGWLGALRDPQVGAALGLIHRLAETAGRGQGAACAERSKYSALSRPSWRLAAGRPRDGQNKPSCSLAASDIRIWSQGGSNTRSTFTSLTPGTARTRSSTS